MPTFMTHALTGAAVSGAMFPLRGTLSLAALSALSAAVPDIDILAFYFGIPYEHWLGHRGFTHSLLFAALWGLLAAAPFMVGQTSPIKLRLYLNFFLVTALHGLLDAMTSGGLGVAFFAPFDNGRRFLPWRPVRVSPIGIGGFLSRRGAIVLHSEFTFIWLPSLALMATALTARFAAGRMKGIPGTRRIRPREK